VAPNAEELHVLPIKKFWHVGKFATDTEPNTVLKYVSTKLKVDASSLSCVKLVKKDVEVTTLNIVNFKLGIPDQLYDSVFKIDFWTNSVKVKRFTNRERAIVVGDGILSNFPESGQTSTSSHTSKNPYDAAGVDTFAGHLLQAFPHLSKAFSQQHWQLLAFLNALSSSSDSLLTHRRQHQPELFLSTLCHFRCPPGSNIGALLGVALSSSCASLPLHYQQHQLELLLSAVRDFRRPPGSNIGALLGVAVSSSCASPEVPRKSAGFLLFIA